MESLFGSLPIPFHRRLTKIYIDTKSSYDFVKEPVQAAEDPELLLLHRKLRIQKDRLVSWGLEWSDPSQSPDIDESINKAGLSELVGSVMSTIKEILAEAEPLWQSSKRPSDDRAVSEKSVVDRKAPLIVWDKTRFEDLVRDLTMSIDTLYDLSRTRQSARAATAAKVESSSTSDEKSPIVEERAFQSTRMQTPKQIDPATLIWPRDLKAINSGMLQPAKSSRQIIFMRRTSTTPNARKGSLQSLPPAVPILLEHAPYDPIYSTTGISPSMTRFEKLFAALSQAHSSLPSGLLRLIGYFEEPDHSRFCLLFDLPTHFGPVDIEVPRMPAITMLSDLLYSKNYEPSLEVKYRLAHNIAMAVFDLHAKGVVHGNVMSSNVLFMEHQSQNRLDLNTVNMRESFLTSFDLFSDNATDSSEPSTDLLLHRHPLDPRTTRYTRLTSESKSLDLYSLAMVLLEIGLWSSLTEIFPNTSAVPEKPIAVFKKLAARCGTLYLKTVKACWNSPVDELSQRARPDVMHQKIIWKVSKALDACCAIDEATDSDTESEGSPPAPSSPTHTPVSSSRARSTHFHDPPTLRTLVSAPLPAKSTNWTEKQPYSKATSPSTSGLVLSPKSVVKPSPKPALKPTLPAPVPGPQDPTAKSMLRIYYNVKISQEHRDFYQQALRPHINHCMRGFYKKYPESVSISLESVGETPTTTKPTILVVCTSVDIVRKLLKKTFVYDKNVYALKVARGKIHRSRKHGSRRSMAHDNELKPANGAHQDVPSNGASIGAFVNEKHLPPVSFGGIILVDDKPYGMTVHHMLDDPDEGEESEDEQEDFVSRSSARQSSIPDLTHSRSSIYSSDEDEPQFSDHDSEFSDREEDSDAASTSYDSDEENEEEFEAGNIPGIPQECGEGYTITQPAIDDVDDSFFPDPDSRDEEHTDSHTLGEIYASSGIRRRVEGDTVHEIDWALFEFTPERTPSRNRIAPSSSQKYCKMPAYPLAVAPPQNLSGLEVHCMGRTSGLQSGRILDDMVDIKIYGRQTPSSTYRVRGDFGVAGDSGAWVVESGKGRACGHVLAWDSRKKLAYICPMDVLLRDIGETLEATTVSFPGGQHVYNTTASSTLARETFGLPKKSVDGGDKELEVMMRGIQLPPTPTEIDAVEMDGTSVPIRAPGRDEGKMGQMPDFGRRGQGKMFWGEGFRVGQEEVEVEAAR